MAKTKSKVDEIAILEGHLKRWSKPVFVESKKDAIAALDEMETIQEFIDPLMQRTVELKKAAQAFAVKTKTTSLDLPQRSMYFRLIQRYTRMWIGTDEDMPDPKPKNAKSLKEITSEIKIKRKGKKTTSLWNLITKRVPDPDLINEAVGKGWITEKKISKAFVEKPQAQFLQRYHGQEDA